MDHELSIQDEALVSLVDNTDLGELMRPLIREIHLFDTFVAGTSHLQDASILAEIQVGDRLQLQREQQNRFDDKAILVLDGERRKLGYIPEKDNVIFSRLLDAGKILVARITRVQQRGSYTEIGIGIYLVDV